jgi:transcriptional regulator of acetoin/glycerol metabolism
MERSVILDSRRMGQEIKASHKRSRQYGINRQERNHNQTSLTPAALAERQRQSRDFLTVVATQIEEFYDLLSPSDFMIGVADSEGYILHMAGSDELLEKFAERNCVPGYRFTEKDVGTSASRGRSRCN